MKKKNDIIAGGVAPYRGRGLVLPNIFHARDASCFIVIYNNKEFQLAIIV